MCFGRLKSCLRAALPLWGTVLALTLMVGGSASCTLDFPEEMLEGECGDASRGQSEQCDDGNQLSGDGCSAGCQHELCGNGQVEGTEACDDGYADACGSCNASCTAAGSKRSNALSIGLNNFFVIARSVLCDEAISNSVRRLPHCAALRSQ